MEDEAPKHRALVQTWSHQSNWLKFSTGKQNYLHIGKEHIVLSPLSPDGIGTTIAETHWISLSVQTSSEIPPSHRLENDKGVWHCQERMVPNTALRSKMCRRSEWLHLAPSAASLKDHTSMLCLPGLLSARSDCCNLRTSQKEVKWVGQLILWIRLLWLGQVGLCLARA